MGMSDILFDFNSFMGHSSLLQYFLITVLMDFFILFFSVQNPSAQL